ncbi:MAG: YmfQ family protein [Oscillospiraceae bacterium]|nr:YmfQ family protein [Oscillospiraceae bacterium]
MVEYDENTLIGYLPAIVTEIAEFQYLLKAQGVELKGVFDGISRVLDQQFVESSSEYGVGRWESILGISPKESLSLDERKFTVFTRLNEKLPYTMRTLREKLEILCGKNNFEVELINDAFTLNVSVALSARSNFNDVKDILEKLVPANLVVNMRLMYNTWGKICGLRLTWESLRNRTWNDLKQGEFDS